MNINVHHFCTVNFVDKRFQIWERDQKRLKERHATQSTSIKSNLVTVQWTQLTVWKLCRAFFSSRLFDSEESLLTSWAFSLCMLKRWHTLCLTQFSLTSTFGPYLLFDALKKGHGGAGKNAAWKEWGRGDVMLSGMCQRLLCQGHTQKHTQILEALPQMLMVAHSILMPLPSLIKWCCSHFHKHVCVSLFGFSVLCIHTLSCMWTQKWIMYCSFIWISQYFLYCHNCPNLNFLTIL